MAIPITAPGINYAFPSKVGGTGTGIKIFPDLITPTLPAKLQVVYPMQGQMFYLVASGSMFLHGTSPTIAPTLQYGLPAVLASGSNTTVSVLTTAQVLATAGAAYPWTFEIEMQGDNASGVIQVLYAKFACNGVGSQTFTNTLITGINWLGVFSDGNLLPPVLPSFAFGLNFGVSDALNTASMYQYAIDY
jgi:hypothetical protein